MQKRLAALAADGFREQLGPCSFWRLRGWM